MEINFGAPVVFRSGGITKGFNSKVPSSVKLVVPASIEVNKVSSPDSSAK